MLSLHVGGGHSLRLKDVIAIVNLASTPPSSSTWELVELLRSEGRLVDVAGGNAKSFILTTRGGYLSAISSVTLQSRLVDARDLAVQLY